MNLATTDCFLFQALAQVVSNLRGINSFIHLVNTAIHKIWPTENSNPLFTTTKVKDYLFGRIPMLCNQEVSLGNMDTKILCESMKIINPRAMFFDDGGKGIHTYSLFRYVSCGTKITKLIFSL